LSSSLKFCRFERSSDGFGINLEDGLAAESYRYEGEGFANGDCGMSISNLNANDATQWRCFVGWNDDKKLSSVLDASAHWNEMRSELMSLQKRNFLSR